MHGQQNVKIIDTFCSVFYIAELYALRRKTSLQK